MKIRVIINSSAGTVRDLSVELLQEEITSAAVELGVKPEVLLAKPNELTKLAKEAASEGYDVVLAVGGDGTVCSVAEGLIGSDTALGVLPLGTFNLLGRDFDLPKEVAPALFISLRGERRSIDVGRVNDKHFLSYSSVGFYPSVVQERDQIGFRNKRQKFLAMVLALFRVLKRMRWLSLWLKSDRMTLRRRTPLIVVGAAKFTFRGGLARRTSTQDEKRLMVSIARAETPWRLILLGIKEVLRLRSHEEGLETLHTSHLTIETKRKKLPVFIDGEVVDISSPLTYSILPGALYLMVPGENSASV